MTQEISAALGLIAMATSTGTNSNTSSATAAAGGFNQCGITAGPTYAGLLPNIPLYQADKTLSIKNFFALLENVASLGHWDDPTKLRVARCRMTGPAGQYVLNELVVSITDYGEFKKALIKRFHYIHPVVQLRQLNACTQHSGEDPRDYAARLQTIADDLFS